MKHSFWYKYYRRKITELEKRDAGIAEIIQYLQKLEMNKHKMYDSELKILQSRAYYYLEYTKRRLNI